MTIQTNTAGTEADPSRLSTIRRLYFYTITWVSLIAGVNAVAGLIRTLTDVWLTPASAYQVQVGNLMRDTIASSGGLLLVATPIFLLHWRYIRRNLTDAGEIWATLRKLYLYLSVGTGIFLLLTNGIPLVRGIAQIASGDALSGSPIWPSRWLFLVLMMALGTALAQYFDRIAQSDGDHGGEVGWGGTMRRLYQTILGLIGLGLLIFGAAGLLETFWRLVLPLERLGTGDNWWSEPFSNSVAMLVFGILVWRMNWQRWSQLAAANPDEAQTALRRFYLYAGVVGSALAALIPAALLLREILLILFGSGTGTTAELLAKLTMPLAYVPVGILAWRWHWRTVSAEAARHDDELGETPASATIRRLYYYLVAAAGLGMVWFGLVELVQMVLDVVGISGLTTSEGKVWVDPLANGLSLLAVGAPIWAAHWRTVQQVARRDDAGGLAERASLPRRVYLYGVLLVGALMILFFLASVVYRLLLLVMGDPNANLFSTQTAGDIARSAISAILWAVHLLALRRDLRLGAEQPVEQAIVASAEDHRAALTARINSLETELAALRNELADLE
ncbi:MAG: hypothetical protein KBG20_02840 [Caldilineaceae bacterium]|nr:hypothetical protein [Caldilineaceae bacterium]MBP8109165.1 hypothetical protein [Caldilineaceae bacterium]MBP8124466.1 hypothetical protein [Caldilineaceae bacterium]MBP9071201.1 hypothetical protein [Caldilineaceae bacterium]